MTSPEQVTFIGAGSPTFTRHAVGDVMLDQAFAGSELVLQDVDPYRLYDITKCSERLASELGVDIRVRSTDSLEGAITDADFVVNSALAGGHSASKAEKEQIAEKTGIYGPVEAHAPFRQLHLAWQIAQIMEKKSPGATLVEAANPLPEIGSLISITTQVPFIGICQGYQEMEKVLPLLRIDPEKADMVIAGINHGVWLLKFTDKDGADLYPQLDAWVKKDSQAFYEASLPNAAALDYQLSPAAAALYRQFGRFPVGDTVRANTPDLWWFHTTSEEEMRWYGPSGGDDSRTTSGFKANRRTHILQGLHDAARTTQGSVVDLFPHKKGLQIVPVIHSISTGEPSIQQVNIPNRGAMAFLEDDFVVEVPAFIDGTGAHHLGPIDIPHPIMIGALIPRYLQAMRHVQAMIEHDSRWLLQQYLAHPKVHSMETAQQILAIRMGLDPEMAAYFANTPKLYEWQK